MFGRWRLKRRKRVASLTEELVAIGTVQGFLLPGGKKDERTQKIGRALHRIGGEDLMQEVHAAVSSRLGRPAPAHLDVAWNGIGEWRSIS